ncbi:hypothetical protein AAFF_G00291030 [Aldrovandia affinis]|uniref:Uncharacterized protein n=1 Tax=Aldrovandia affinis TaxID=143900 RepID=A0AAD7R9C9_9TELE|nr:hypothetical protein AAFF_G00291030 [Aldrovandia affinis]
MRSSFSRASLEFLQCEYMALLIRVLRYLLLSATLPHHLAPRTGTALVPGLSHPAELVECLRSHQGPAAFPPQPRKNQAQGQVVSPQQREAAEEVAPWPRGFSTAVRRLSRVAETTRKVSQAVV